jgi:hypothetical protein
MSKEMVDVPVRLTKELADKLNKMTKKEAIEKACSLAVEAKVYEHRCNVAIEDADRADKEKEMARQEVEILQTKLDKSEAYVEQGRAMINSVMERWYEYDA